MIGSAPLSGEERSEKTTVIIKGKETTFELIKCGYLYLVQMPNGTPMAQIRWVAEGKIFDNWRTIYKRAFKVTASSLSID